jgi:hypothetical protein
VRVRSVSDEREHAPIRPKVQRIAGESMNADSVCRPVLGVEGRRCRVQITVAPGAHNRGNSSIVA